MDVQEKILSCRILFFTDYQVYYKCSESIWTEEIALETDHVSKSVEARPAKYKWPPNRNPQNLNIRRVFVKQLTWLTMLKTDMEDESEQLGGLMDYLAAVMEYTKRHFSDQRDSPFAIADVLETLKSVTGDFVLGLPKSHILEALLWYPEVGSTHSYDVENDLPSWTWASSVFRRGGVSFDLMDVREFGEPIKLIARGLEHGESPVETARKPAGFGTVASMAGNLTASIFQTMSQKDAHVKDVYFCDRRRLEGIDFGLPDRMFGDKDWSTGPVLKALFSAGDPSQRSRYQYWKPNINLLPKIRPALALRTAVVQFNVGRSILPRSKDADEEEVGLFEITNSMGQCIGEVRTTLERALQRD